MPEPSNDALVVVVIRSGQYYSTKCSFKFFTVFLKEIWMTILLLEFPAEESYGFAQHLCQLGPGLFEVTGLFN